jgi:hypothetical protein
MGTRLGERAGRDRGAGKARRRRGLHDAVGLGVRPARGQVRVVWRLGHRQHRRDARVGAREHLRPLGLRPAGETLGEQGAQFRPPGPVVLGRDAGPGAVRREQQPDELRVEPRLERADRHVPAVRRGIHVVERRAGIQQVHPALVRPRAPGEQAVGHGLQHRRSVHDGGVHDLAAPGLPGFKQRRQHAKREEHGPAAEVPQVVHRDLRRAAAAPDRVQRASDRDVGDVVPG